MTIKEIEEKSGMTRANIRFYENEGLIHPTRRENGYRDYSEGELAELKKIKLLRALDLPLEEIRKAKEGQLPLEELLAEQLPRLRAEEARLENAGTVCDEMRRNGVEYETLDAQRYLDTLERTALPESDTLPKVRAPWRRLFARSLDYGICHMLFFAALGLFTTENLGDAMGSFGWKLLSTLVTLGLVLLLEPLLLHTFGTTPGKWIFGLSVTDLEDGRLSIRAARERTFEVLLFGEAFLAPCINPYFNWKSYRACMDEEELPWEGDSLLVLKDERPWRVGAYVGLEVLMTTLLVTVAMCQSVPKNRGTLSVAEYAENFNRLAMLEKAPADMRLDERGQWTEEFVPPGNIIMHIGKEEYPRWTYTVKDGHLTGMEFAVEVSGQDIWTDSFLEERSLAIMAFVRANAPLFHVGDDTRHLIREMVEDPFGTLDTQVNGVRVCSRVESEGVYFSDDQGIGCMVEEGVEGYFRLEFSMEQVS